MQNDALSLVSAVVNFAGWPELVAQVRTPDGCLIYDCESDGYRSLGLFSILGVLVAGVMFLAAWRLIAIVTLVAAIAAPLGFAIKDSFGSLGVLAFGGLLILLLPKLFSRFDDLNVPPKSPCNVGGGSSEPNAGRVDEAILSNRSIDSEEDKQDDAAAMFNKAQRYRTGADGISIDLAKAREWYTRAALAGDGDAQYNLALLLWREKRKNRDDAVESVAWAKIASERYVSDANRLFRSLYNCLSPLEKVRANSMAKELAEHFAR